MLSNETFNNTPGSPIEGGVNDATIDQVLKDLEILVPEETEANSTHKFPLIDSIREYIYAKNERISTLEYEKDHDPLTDLYNRRGFYHAAEMLLPTLGENDAIVISWADMDNFKPVNDRFNHKVGDDLLVAMAKGLKSIAGPKDIVARFGGDEFVILHVVDLLDRQFKHKVTGQLKECVSQVANTSTAPWQGLGIDMTVMQSTDYGGIYSTMKDLDNMLLEADLQMIAAKHDRKEHHARTHPANWINPQLVNPR